MKKKQSPSKEIKQGMQSVWVIRIAIVLLSLLLYGQSIGYEYTLDDQVVFTNNETVLKGVKGVPQLFVENSFKGFAGGGALDKIYRPFTLSTYAIEKSVAGINPELSHFINILLYVLCGLILFSNLRLVFKQWPVWICGAVSLLFIAHPIHTEVVCSVKSRDELLGMLLGFSAINFFIRGYSANDMKKLLLSALLFLLAFFSKESSLTLILIVPVAIFFSTELDFKKLLKAMLPIAVAVVVFFVFRFIALQGTYIPDGNTSIALNVLNAANGFSEVLGTKLRILFLFLSKLLLPIPLSWDYSYNQVPVTSLFSPTALLTAVIYLGMLLVVIFRLKKKDAMAFGILFFLVTSSITNNFFIKLGTTFGERLLFVPSIGFLILIPGAIIYFLKDKVSELPAIQSVRMFFIVLLTGYSIVTFAYTPAWKNDIELARFGVRNSPDSYKTHAALGGQLLQLSRFSTTPADSRNYLEEARICYEKSLSILPSNFDAYYNLGLISGLMGDMRKSVDMYKESLKYAPYFRNSLHNLGVIYTDLNQSDSALFYLNRIDTLSRDYAMEYIPISFAYAQKKEFEKSKYYAEKGIKAMPKVPDNYKNLSVALINLGDTAGAMYYYTMFREMGGKD